MFQANPHSIGFFERSVSFKCVSLGCLGDKHINMSCCDCVSGNVLLCMSPPPPKVWHSILEPARTASSTFKGIMFTKKKIYLTHLCLNLPLLRLFSSKAQRCKDFWKLSEPCHVGIQWISLTEHSQMITDVAGFQWFFWFFCIILYWPILFDNSVLFIEHLLERFWRRHVNQNITETLFVLNIKHEWVEKRLMTLSACNGQKQPDNLADVF